MEFRKNKLGLLVLAALAALLPLAGCSGGGSTTPTSNNTNSSGETISSLTSGYQVPSEISAVPESSTDSGAASLRSLSRAVADLAATTDYQKAIPAKYVEEPVLDQFEIIEEVLSALNQTRYYDPVNINQGPYKAMISWTEDREGREVKTLESWIVDSRMIVVDGKDINRVYCWIEEEGELVKAEFKVYEPAVFDDEGEVTSYGRWELNVKFDETGDNFFVATAEPNGSGGVLIKINEYENFEGKPHSLKGVLNRSNSSGYGKMEYPDWESCDGPDCSPAPVTAEYAYNAGYLAVKKGADPVVYKDRGAKVAMTHQYGLFYNETPQTAGVSAGDDVRKHKQFGFPLRYTDYTDSPTGITTHAYYGAWQGRHELWAGDGGGGNNIPAGAELEKESWGDAAKVTYTVADRINGSFTKRTLADATLDDIKGVPVETWIDKNFDLMYGDLGVTGTDWYFCKGWIDWSSYYPGDPSMGTTPIPPTCKDFNGGDIGFTLFSDYNALVVADQNDRKWVNISGQDAGGFPVEYVYLNDEVGPNYLANYTIGNEGFYPATRDDVTGQLVPNGDSVYVPVSGDNLWVSIGGSIYIVHTGTDVTGWVQKKLVDFDYDNWQPILDNSVGADKPFSPQVGREYYLNSNGVNYVVRRVAEDPNSTAFVPADYEVRLEIQTTANPRNCTSGNSCAEILPAGTAYLRNPWDREVKLVLGTNEASTGDYLLLKYLAVGSNSDVADGDTVQTGMWGLQAFNNLDQPLDASGNLVTVDEWGNPTNPDQRPVEFNWEYCDPTSGQNQCWGAQTYLKDAGGNYVILADPIILHTPDGGPFTVKDGGGATLPPKNLVLQYDGWLHGLPDIHEALRQGNGTVDPEIESKIINIPAGTEVTDGIETYYLKPLETSIFLKSVTELEIAGDSVPDVTPAAAIDLATLPTFTEHGMGAMPTVTKVKFSEGILVE